MKDGRNALSFRFYAGISAGFGTVPDQRQNLPHQTRYEPVVVAF
jgi:hypothetical protein